MSSSNQRPANRGFRSVLRCAISHYRQFPWLSAPEPQQGGPFLVLSMKYADFRYGFLICVGQAACRCKPTRHLPLIEPVGLHRSGYLC